MFDVRYAYWVLKLSQNTYFLKKAHVGTYSDKFLDPFLGSTFLTPASPSQSVDSAASDRRGRGEEGRVEALCMHQAVITVVGKTRAEDVDRAGLQALSLPSPSFLRVYRCVSRRNQVGVVVSY